MKILIPISMIMSISSLIACSPTIRKPNFDSTIIPINGENTNKEYTIILGKLMGQSYVPDVLPSSCYKPDLICTSSFYHNKILVHEVISGDSVFGEIQAVRLQHGEFFYRGSDLSVFVLEKITNKNSVKLLKTNYFLEEYIKPEVNYCFSKSLKEQLPELDEYKNNCINQEYTAGGIKEDKIQRISEEVELMLDEDKILIKTDYEYSDGETIIYDIEEELEECLDEMDLDILEKNPICLQANLTHDVNLYFLKKGTAESVKQMIIELVNESTLNLKDVHMNFIIKEKGNISILEWHYRINHITKL